MWLTPQYLAGGLPLLLHLFTAYTPPHRCFIEGCDIGTDLQFDTSFLAFSIPSDDSSSTFLRESMGYDECSMYQRLNGSSLVCSKDQFSKEPSSCSKFVYDRSEFPATITTELDLVCDQVQRRHFMGSVMMMGLTLGSLLGGPIGDKIGRKKAMFIGITVAVPCVFLGGFTTNYELYIVLRLLACTTIVFSWISAHNFQIEYFSKSYRRVALTLNNLTSHIIGFTLPLLAYYFRHWSTLHVVVAVTSSLAIPTYFVIPESYRWLATNGRWQEAETILKEMAHTNGKVISEKDAQAIRTALQTISQEAKAAKEVQLTVYDMFGSHFYRKTLILMGLWISGILSYYALALNVDGLAGDIFVNYVVTTLADIPAHLSVFLLVDSLGRRKCMASSFIGLGISCLLMAFVPKQNSTLILLLYLVGKYCASFGISMCWLVTSELYPTNLRSQAVGTCSMVARIFGMTSSFISELAVIWSPLPMLVMGVPSILAGVSSLLLPETTGKALPETLEEAMELDYPMKVMPNLVLDESMSESEEECVGLLDSMEVHESIG
ncbi:organic cation transporter protein-like isoform X2 [Tigriopus californicus]|nr:organic cation transporter protein-like isoform X2 [Tigriopus californicus]